MFNVRYSFLLLLVGVLATTVFAQQSIPYERNITSINIVPTDKEQRFPIRHSDAAWERIIGDEFAHYVLRHEGTERAFSGKLNYEKRKGIYYSRATGQPLFSSDHKYESGTGWPSFWRPLTRDAVRYHVDRGIFGTRIEVVDSSSGSHLGHVFSDGPAPTGYRYCLNSAALIFVPEGENPPQIVLDYIEKYL